MLSTLFWIASLDRVVALKVLPSRFSNQFKFRRRFEIDVKSVAALAHPNILAIYDFGLHSGLYFAVMEHLEGQTLRQRLNSAIRHWFARRFIE